MILRLLHLHVRNNQNMSERKNARNLKKIQLRSDDDIFLKNFGKIYKF